jgi:glycosyltransferase involved in cell wall biosynthesis
VAKTILYVTENFPAATSGASVATLGTLRTLERGGWDVHLVLNVRRGDVASLDAVREVVTTLTPVPRPRMRVTPVGDWVRSLGRFGYVPRWQPEMWHAVEAALRAGGVGLVFLDHIRAAEYGRLVKERGHRVPVALREHNVEHELNARIAPEMARRWERFETRLRAHRYHAIESNLSRYCDLALPISHVDAEKLAALNPGLPCVALPSPVDTDHYRPAAGPPSGKEIVFVGGMGYGPNRDAVTWFVREVLPAVIARHPDVRFTAVGEKPPEWFSDHRPHVQGVGFVPDERVYVARGRVFIAPIRYGSGVRTKILNALAMGRPVVATRAGAEGLLLEDRRSIVLADEAHAFADAVSRILEDDAWATALAEGGRRECLATYAPERVADRLRDAFARVAA